MPRGKGRSARPTVLVAFDQIGVSDTLPSLQTFLDLGRELVSARLDYFATIPDTNPFIDPMVGYAFNLLLAVTDCVKYPEHQDKRNDVGKAKAVVESIQKQNCWLYVRDQLVKLTKRLETELATRQPLSNEPIPRRSGPRSKNDQLLEFDLKVRKKNPNLTDKEVLDLFQEKYPNHPIFQAEKPKDAFRAARSRKNKKPKT